MSVCAVVCSGPLAPEVLAAVEAQGPELAIADLPSLAGAVWSARAHQTRWVWLLDGAAVPQPRALRALLAASDSAPALLASQVVDEHGWMHPDATPRHEIVISEAAVDAAQRRLVLLRAAAPGSVLVSRGAIARAGPPRSDLPPGLDMLEWSARILRDPDQRGYLVPASVAVRPLPPSPTTWRHLLTRARVLGSSAWTPRDRLREGYRLGRDAVAKSRPGSGRPASAHRADRGRQPGSHAEPAG